MSKRHHIKFLYFSTDFKPSTFEYSADLFKVHNISQVVTVISYELSDLGSQNMNILRYLSPLCLIIEPAPGRIYEPNRLVFGRTLAVFGTQHT